MRFRRISSAAVAGVFVIFGGLVSASPVLAASVGTGLAFASSGQVGPATAARVVAPLTMGSFPAAAYVKAGAGLPSGLKAAIARDLKLSPSQYLADAATAARANTVVASLRQLGVTILDYDVSGTKLQVHIPHADARAATNLIHAAGGEVLLGSPHPVASLTTSTQPNSSTNLLGGGGFVFSSVRNSSAARCSIGFNGYDLGTGASQFLTAGHCAGDMNGAAYASLDTTPNSGGFSSGALIGNAVAGENSYGGGINDDYGIVAVTGSGWSPLPGVTTWGGGQSAINSTPPLLITGTIAPVTGADICNSGSTSGWSCGKITQVGSGYYPGLFSTACSQSGDSGGAEIVGTMAVALTTTGSCDRKTSDSSGGFPIVSTNGDDSVTSQLGTKWELSVSVSDPIVTSISNTTISGTLANASTGSTVTLTIDGVPGSAVTVSAANGTWTTPVAAHNNGTFTAQGSWGKYSHSNKVTKDFPYISPPSFTSAKPASTLHVGVSWSFTFTASGAAPITYSVSSGTLPNGLSLNSSTGVLSGAPTTAGSFRYSVKATNSAGSQTAAPIHQTVNGANNPDTL